MQCHCRAPDSRSMPLCGQHFRNDLDLAALTQLKTISSPATTTTTAWAGDLVATIIADVADNLLPQTALAQLRALGLQYKFVNGGIARVPMHTPTPSGAFVGEGGPIPVAALILSSLSLKPKKAAITALTREMAQGSPIKSSKPFVHCSLMISG